MPNGRQVARDDGVYLDNAWMQLHDLDLLASGLLALFRSANATQTRKNQDAILLGNVAVATHGNHYVLGCNGIVDQLDITPSTPMNLQDVAMRARLTNVVEVKEGAVDTLVKEDKKLYSVINRGNDGTLFKKYYEPVHYRSRVKEKAAEQIAHMLSDAAHAIAKPDSVTILDPTDGFNPHGEMRIVKYFADQGWPLGFIGVCKPCCENCANELDRGNIGYSRWSELGLQHTGWKPPAEITDTKPVLV